MERCIQLQSGIIIDLDNPDLTDVSPTIDIAVPLSRICRYSGHCSRFYSVAEHSLLVESLISPDRPELKLPALLHDAHEVLWGFGDPLAPAKLMPFIKTFLNRLSNKFDRAIADKFGIDEKLMCCEEVDLADKQACAIEKVNLMDDFECNHWPMLDGIEVPEHSLMYPGTPPEEIVSDKWMDKVNYWSKMP